MINTAITDPYLKSFRPVFEATGKRIGLIEKFDQKATDFKTELTKIKAANPTDIFLIASPKLVGLILKQANDLGLKAQFYNIGVEGPDIVLIAGPLAEGLLYPYSYDNHGREQEVKIFYEKYQQKFGGEPDTLAANSYDVAYLLSECLEENGDDVEKVKICLYNTKDFKGASGMFSIDQNGDAVKNIFIKIIKNGKFVRFSEWWYSGEMKRIIQFRISKGEKYYVAEGIDLPVVTQALTLDELARNIEEAVALHLKGENLAALGLVESPSVLANFELPVAAYA